MSLFIIDCFHLFLMRGFIINFFLKFLLFEWGWKLKILFSLFFLIKLLCEFISDFCKLLMKLLDIVISLINLLFKFWGLSLMLLGKFGLSLILFFILNTELLFICFLLFISKNCCLIELIFQGTKLFFCCSFHILQLLVLIKLLDYFLVSFLQFRFLWSKLLWLAVKLLVEIHNFFLKLFDLLLIFLL